MKRNFQLLPLFFLAAPFLAGFSSTAVQKDQHKESPWWGWAVLIALILLIVLWVMWLLSKKGETASKEAEPTDQALADSRAPSLTPEEPSEPKAEASMASRAPSTASIEEKAEPSEPDDLKVIEGIGPKIEQLLHEAGILTYKDLASAKVETLEAVLEKAGPRFRLADPATWPKQAALAAEGRWDDLKKLQDSLKGGREV